MLSGFYLASYFLQASWSYGYDARETTERRDEKRDIRLDYRLQRQQAVGGIGIIFIYGGLLAFKMLRVLINGSKIQYGEHPLL